MKSIKKKIGERIRFLRESSGLLQRELAKAADLPARTVGRIERGEVDPRLSSLVKIADALKIDIRDLLP